MTRAILLEGDPENLNEVPVLLDVEHSSEDCLTLWATRQGSEGMAHPGLELTPSQAVRLSEELRAVAKGGSTDG